MKEVESLQLSSLCCLLACDNIDAAAPTHTETLPQTLYTINTFPKPSVLTPYTTLTYP